jgi:hypothetical protein
MSRPGRAMVEQEGARKKVKQQDRKIWRMERGT